MAQTRQLAAIMFTDIVGYTALMGEDERKALNILEQNRETHKKLIIQYQGKYLKEIGDGSLATFNSSTDAVYCAGKLIKASKVLGYQLKVALHEGEVVYDNNDVFGDGVNITARLESEAGPGQIFSTASISRNVKNKEGISISFIGEKYSKMYPTHLRFIA